MKFLKDKKGKKWLIYLILGGFLFKLFRYIFKGDNEKKIAKNFKDFFSKEKKEVDELTNGEETLARYIKDSTSIFENYFIPHEGNEFKPKILRTKSLAIIGVILLILKLSVVSYLFFVYPNLARMSQIIQEEIYGLINQERQVNNMAILTPNDKLNMVAKIKAEDMINKDYFAHKGPDGKMIWDLIDRNEYPYLYVGENLAMNFTSAQSAHNALMLSKTHKKNILNGKYTDIGIAVVSGELNGEKTNVLVQVFAYPKPIKQALATNTGLEEEIKPPDTAVQPTTKLTGPVLGAENTTTVSAKDEEPVKESDVLSIENKPADSDLKDIEEPLPAEEEILPSPNEELEARVAAPAREVRIDSYNRFGAAAKVVNYSQYAFIGALILLIILFFINVFVKITIQHKPVIIQTLLLIIFIYGLFAIKLHFLENITESIIII